MPSLQELIGHTVVIRSVVLHEERPTTAKLLSLEQGGIWVESQEATEHWLREVKRQATPRTLVWFVPYAQVAWIMESADYPALSEERFGV